MVFVLGAIIILINLLYHVDEGKEVKIEEVKSTGLVLLMLVLVLGLGYLVMALDEHFFRS